MNYKELYAVACRTTGCKEKAKDLSQDLYIKMATSNSFKKAQRDGKELNWLYRTAKNLWIDEHRRKVKEVREFTPEQDELVDPYDLLMKAKGKLSEIDYLWLTTYIDYNQNYSEISRHFEISRQQASENIRRIIRSLNTVD